MRAGNEMYAGCWMSGVAIVDISDIGKPRTLSHYEYNPPHPEPTHTFLKVPFEIGGRKIAVSTEEERGHRGADAGKPHAPFRTWDVTDPAKPTILCTYEVPHSASPYDGNKVRFGAHQLREQVDKDGLCLRHLVRRGPAHPRHQRSGASEGARLHHSEARRRPGRAAHQRRRDGQPRPDLFHRQGLRPRRDRIQRLMAGAVGTAAARYSASFHDPQKTWPGRARPCCLRSRSNSDGRSSRRGRFDYGAGRDRSDRLQDLRRDLVRVALRVRAAIFEIALVVVLDEAVRHAD